MLEKFHYLKLEIQLILVITGPYQSFLDFCKYWSELCTTICINIGQQKKMLYVKLFGIQTQQSFQRCFKVAFWLIRRRDVGQRQINVETMLCILTLEFTTSNKFESMLCI